MLRAPDARSAPLPPEGAGALAELPRSQTSPWTRFAPGPLTSRDISEELVKHGPTEQLLVLDIVSRAL